jgi:hypothetical protein
MRDRASEHVISAYASYPSTHAGHPVGKLNMTKRWAHHESESAGQRRERENEGNGISAE